MPSHTISRKPQGRKGRKHFRMLMSWIRLDASVEARSEPRAGGLYKESSKVRNAHQTAEVSNPDF